MSTDSSRLAEIEMYSYDHDLEEFVTIGLGTVSKDGATVMSNLGVGVIKAGWTCGSAPAGSGAAHDCGDCEACIDGTCAAKETEPEKELSKSGKIDAKGFQVSYPEIAEFFSLPAVGANWDLGGKANQSCCADKGGELTWSGFGVAEVYEETGSGSLNAAKTADLICKKLIKRYGERFAGLECNAEASLNWDDVVTQAGLNASQNDCSENSKATWSGSGYFAVDGAHIKIGGGASVSIFGKREGSIYGSGSVGSPLLRWNVNAENKVIGTKSFGDLVVQGCFKLPLVGDRCTDPSTFAKASEPEELDLGTLPSDILESVR